MTLPTFLGIGTPRSGSTWLNQLLGSHPDVYIPPQVDEVSFFNQHYERGLDWYQKFFPDEAQADQYQAIGEFTPHYLYPAECPERISRIPSITKLIVLLRNPIDRAYSHYWHRVRADNYSGSFEEFLSDYRNAIPWGNYSQYLKHYLRYFERDQILVLISEHTADLQQTKETLAGFLGIVADRFPSTAGTRSVNKGYVPRARFAHSLAIKGVKTLRGWELYRIVNLVKRLTLRVRGIFSGGPLPEMKPETRVHLQDVYAAEFTDLEELLEMELECWKS